jgi:coenzyme PQQ precursor peptide PqqA
VRAAPVAERREQQSKEGIAMEWETPEFVEISLACEISGYANAELSVAVSVLARDVTLSTKN